MKNTENKRGNVYKRNIEWEDRQNLLWILMQLLLEYMSELDVSYKENRKTGEGKKKC